MFIRDSAGSDTVDASTDAGLRQEVIATAITYLLARGHYPRPFNEPIDQKLLTYTIAHVQ